MKSAIILTAVHASGALAWGSMGHQTVAYIASNFVKSTTKTWAQNILSDTSADYLANVATWADSYRYTSAGKFSAPYHYIDAEDNPPNSCSVDYNRDCGDGGCSVSAIANYTQRVQSKSLSATQVNYALKFLVHFLGDITQPLHDEAVQVGGNNVDVTYASKDNNLHHIWDTEMPNQYRGGSALADASSWANAITSDIRSGKYKSSAASWIQSQTISDPVTSAMRWATDANTYVCSKVMPNGYQALETGDLSGDYYNGVISTIELQIAKGGYRLANWLDQIAAKASKRDLIEEDLEERDLVEDFMPIPQAMPLSRAKLARMAVGYGCRHPHEEEHEHAESSARTTDSTQHPEFVDNMASSGVTVSPECVSTFNELKLGKSTKWIIYKLSDNQKEVVVEATGKEQDWESFRQKLIDAKSADGKVGARYAVYDLAYEVEGGGQRNKIIFIAWSPDTAGIKTKMIYSSSKESLKRALNGVAVEIQANDEEDIEQESITSRAAKGGR